MLLKYRESLNTECRIAKPILKMRAIKIDSNTDSLKNFVGCKDLKSCDYIKKRKKNLYFIEVSDFNAQLEDLSRISTDATAKKYIKMEVKLKLSETILIFEQICKKFKINVTSIKNHKVLLSICKEKQSDVIVFDRLARELTQHYCPTHFSSVQIIPYTKLESIFL